MWVTDGGEVANRNAAYALASCSACTTVAVAFQVVLVVGQSNVVVPQNLAVAGNAQCRGCTTTALALQLVATLRELPSKDVQAQIAAAWSRLEGLDLAAADLGVNEVYAQVRAVQAEILGILVSNHLLASDPSRSDTASTPAVLALPFGISIASGPLGFLLLLVLTALWAVTFSGFMQLIALKTRSAAATNSGGLVFFPLLFLTPNFVPRDLLTRPMEIAATFNPVTYVMEALRSLILQDFALAPLARGLAVLLALALAMLALNVRLIKHFD